jgi:[ribosomal protein S18]-alanine N-acetyltransferase
MGSDARTTVAGVRARVVRAAREHLPSILRIERESFSDPWSEDAFLGMIDSPLALLSVALDDDDRVIGYAAATGAWEDGELLNIAVDASARGKGIGGALLDWAIEALREQLVDRVFLEVRESNVAAIALYQSRGFAEVSVRRNYYRGPVENAMVLKLELRTATERDPSCG